MAFKWNVIEWLKDFGSSGDTKKASVKSITSDDIDSPTDMGVSAWLKLAIFDSAVKRVGSSLASCEYTFYEKGVEKKGEEYWRWNYEPNLFQNKETFFGLLAYHLFYNQEVLIVKKNGQYFIADSFQVTNSVFSPSKYYDIWVSNGNARELYSYNPVYEDDVFYIKLNGQNVNQIAELVTSSVGELARLITTGYKNAVGTKGILHIADSVSTSENYEEEVRNYVKNTFSPLYKNSDVVIPLFDGYSFEQLTNSGSKETATALGQNIPQLVSSYTDYISYITGVPKGLLSMDFTGNERTSLKLDDLLDLYINFTIRNLANQICNEINRKTAWTVNGIGKNGVLKGYYMEPNLNTVKLKDPLSAATDIDKLIACGAFSVNEVRGLVSYRKLDEEWADKHFMTKNYTVSSEVADGVSDEETIVIKEGGNENA